MLVLRLKGLISLLAKLDYKPALPVKIFTDNNKVPPFITTNASRRRSRNIDMKYHFILDFIRQELVPFPLHPFAPTQTLRQRVLARSIIPFSCHTLGMLTDEIVRRCNDFKWRNVCLKRKS